LDPKRVQQATAEMWDAKFCKLNSYVQMLYAMKVISCQTYNQIPPDYIYNMDELGNDTMKLGTKYLARKQMQGQTCMFMCTTRVIGG